MFLMFPILFKCISLCRLSCCGWMLPDPTTALICTRTILAVHGRLGPPVTSYTQCWTLRYPGSWDRDAEVQACSTVSGLWLSEINVSPDSGSGIQLQAVHIYFGQTSLFLYGCLRVLTDRLATCPTARCHVCLQNAVWAGPPESRQAKGQRDKEIALLGEAGNCDKTFGDVDRVSLPTVSRGAELRQRLHWDEMFRLRGWKWGRKGKGGELSADRSKWGLRRQKTTSPSSNLKASAELYLLL